jgi:hypothetical protein
MAKKHGILYGAVCSYAHRIALLQNNLDTSLSVVGGKKPRTTN